MGQMLVQEGKRAAAIPLRIFKLSANLARRLALPGHFDGRESPARMAGNALIGHAINERIVSFTMAGAAGIARDSTAIRAARYGWEMLMPVIALRRAIVGGMAVDAARMHDDLGDLSIQRARAFSPIRNAGKCQWLTQIVGLGPDHPDWQERNRAYHERANREEAPLMARRLLLASGCEEIRHRSNNRTLARAAAPVGRAAHPGRGGFLGQLADVTRHFEAGEEFGVSAADTAHLGHGVAARTVARRK
jgi:hypothetical protein